MTEQPKTSRTGIRRRWRVVAGLAVTVILVLIALPPVVQWGLSRTLLRMGAQQVEIQDVDLNLFTARAGIRAAVVQGPGGQSASLDHLRVGWRWWGLFKRRLDVTEIELRGLSLPVGQRGQRWTIAGFALPEPAPDEESQGLDWGFALRRLALEQIDVKLDLPAGPQHLAVDTFMLSSVVSWTPETGGSGEGAGRLNGAAFQLGSDLHLFAESPRSQVRLSFEALALAPFAGLVGFGGLSGKLSADAVLDIGQRLDGSLRLTHSGTLELRDLVLPVAPGGRIELARAELNGELGLTASGSDRPELDFDGALSLRQVVLRLPGDAQGEAPPVAGMALDLERAGVAGALRYGGSGEPAGGELSFSGEVDVSGLLATVAESQIETEAVTWTGEVALALAPPAGREAPVQAAVDGEPDAPATPAAGARIPRLEGTLGITGVAVRRGAQGPLLAAAKVIELQRLSSAQAGGLRSDSLRLSGLTVLETDALGGDRKAVVSSGEVRVAPVTLRLGATRTRVAAGRLSVEGLDGVIRRTAEGDFAGFAALGVQQGSGSAAPPEPAGSRAAAVTFVLGELTVAPGSRIRFQDRSVAPPFDALIEVTELRVADIDTAEPERRSPYRLAASVNEFGKLDLEGAVRLLGAEPTLTAKGFVVGLELPPLSSYTAPAIGYDLTSGQFASDIDFDFRDGEIDGVLELRLANIQVASAGNQETQRTVQLLGSPLETILNTVRDSKNNVRLTLPVRGNLRDPRFDLSSVIGTAMVGAVQSAVVTYVKVSVLPLTALSTVLDVVSGASQIRLTPVQFAPGEGSASDDLAVYLEELAAVAKQRQGLRFRLCGFATAADAAVLGARTEALRSLANERASLVKRNLIEAHGLAAERLFLCRPSVVDDNSPPRLEVQIDK